MKSKITIVLTIVTLALIFLCASSTLMKDRQAPEILVPEVMITYMEGSDESVLLEGVTAKDDKDGDISSNVRIYDIAVLEDGTRAQVTYAVYDSSYNLGKGSRVVLYQEAPDEEPEIKEEPETTEEPEPQPETTEAPVETTEEIPAGYEDLPLESDGSPVIRLTTHDVRIDVGGEFYSMDYVEDAVDLEDSREELYRNMYLEGEYHTDTAGEYELTYYCVDSDGHVSNYAKLKLIVGGDNDTETEDNSDSETEDGSDSETEEE